MRKNKSMNMRRMFIRWIIGLFVIAAPLASAGTSNKTQEWIEVLQSDKSIFEKARACQRLGESGTKEAVPALSALLNHTVLSAYARAGLERIPGPEASAALRDALVQTRGKFLVGVINSLAALRDENAVTALIALTRNPDPQVARAALLALGRISNGQALPIVRRALIAGPEEFRPDAAAACLLAAEHQLNQGRFDVAQALYDAVRQAPVPESCRIGATRGAIVARKSDRVPFLIQQLRADEPAICDVALLTIRDIPSDALATALNTELEGAQGYLQIQLISALKDCHNAQSIQVIKTKVQSADPEVRLAALRVLAAIGSSDDAPTFLGVMSDHPGAEELSIAAKSLEQMEGVEVDELILKAVRSSGESETRIQLIRLLSKRNATGATNELLRQAASSDRNVSIAAFQALKSLAGFDELPRLIALTKECRDDSARNAAVNAVYGACRNSERVDQAGSLVLKELKTSAVTVEKESWIKVLALLGYAKALPAITASLQDADPKLVQSTISHLSRWPDPTPIDALFGVVEGNSNPSLRRQALMVVLQLATTAADRSTATDEELIVWFRRAGKAVRSVQEKRLLISGLGRVKHIESVRLSASYLGDADVKTEAVYAIVNAAEPLVKGPDYKAVEAVLKRISGVQDQRLLKRIANLERDIKSTAIRLSR
jgi:HEAT repeat protein